MVQPEGRPGRREEPPNDTGRERNDEHSLSFTLARVYAVHVVGLSPIYPTELYCLPLISQSQNDYLPQKFKQSL
jgi:hypothetical protein